MKMDKEISEAPQISPITIVDLQENKSNYPLVLQINGQGNSTHLLAEAAAVHKPRIRWTSELHEIFLDAVNKLVGPENATPKGILKLVNVEGLNYYHVKSHLQGLLNICSVSAGIFEEYDLQKYRLEKNVPELKHDKRASISEEKKLASTNNDNDECMTSRGMSVTEALRLQIEIQKQLHEQLKVQNSLQLLLVQHGEYLRLRMLSEEQEQAGSALIPATASP